MTTARRLILLAGFALPLAACQDNAPRETNASGEILPASASDAMLPEDRLTSAPPLDPTAQRAGRASDAPEATATAQATTAPAAEAATTPAE